MGGGGGGGWQMKIHFRERFDLYLEIIQLESGSVLYDSPTG